MRLASLLAFAVLASACTRPPPARPIAMESLGSLAPETVRALHLHVGEAAVLIDQVALVEAGDPSLLRMYMQEDTLAVVGKKLGATSLRLVGREGDVSVVKVEVVSGEPSPRALGVGETFVVPMKGVKEYSVGLPGIVAVTLTGDGSQLVVTGRKAGTTTLVVFDESGTSVSRELVVIAGQRMEIALSKRIAEIDETPAGSWRHPSER